ncbi:hypothetical protein V9T40_004145 [Parthenolecanium corni]|uniref:Glucosylceramidase n=1 Tax=Parthenolecanium corni TaxID=536013 RepID=A0AAN9TEI6_9HEMI
MINQKLTTLSRLEAVDSNACIPRKFNFDSVVCVCNATYCDTLSNIRAPLAGNYVIYTSSRDGLRFQRSVGSFQSKATSEGVKYKIYSKRTFQEIYGFGGAFTDSAGINILSLSEPAQNLLLQSYFSKDGLEYVLGRVPIGGTDFSTRGYTYQDNSTDASLKSFSLTQEDLNYKIPIIKRAQSYAQKSLKLIASCWSPPKWMKTNHELTGFGVLKDEYYKAYANYHVKFLDAYKENAIDVWCITTGNEPMNGLLIMNKLNAVGWTPTSQRRWIGQHLGPNMRSSHPNVCILTGDDQRYTLPWWLKTVMEDKEAAKYINGTAVHWYWDFIIPPVQLRKTHEDFPNLFIINSEASYGDKPWDWYKVALGAWKRAEEYAHDIIQDLNNWLVGWVDWNLALNEEGGPTYIKNFVDSPIIVNEAKDEFYKQPMFYAIGHFSKFLTPGSVRIENSVSPANVLETVSVKRPDQSIAIVVLNKKSYDVKLSLANGKDLAVINIPKYSVNSILYKEKT